MADVRTGSVITPPDSRLRDRLKGIVRGLLPGVGMVNWVPIFCANCGRPNGYVPEENMDFVCWLCNGCAAKCGPELAGMMIPDEIFWMKAQAEQLERHGRILNMTELQVAADSPCTALGKLLRDKR